MSVYEKWRIWQKRANVTGPRYAMLFARLVKSPAAERIWRFTPRSVDGAANR